MRAVILAGGEDTQLYPLTIRHPKSMFPIVNKPIMSHILDLLKRYDITEVIITVGYLADMIQDFFGDGSSLGMQIHYSVEETPLGTAGSVKNAQNFLDETFLVISGDVLTNFNLHKLVEYHKSNGNLVTLALYHSPNIMDYGVVTLANDDGQIVRFQEKPSRGAVMSDLINTGIYVLEPEVLDFFEPNMSFDFANDLFPMLHEQGNPLYGYVGEGYWCDVGNIPEYMRANADALEGRVEGLDLGHYLGNGIWAGQDVKIVPTAHLEGPIYLGHAVQIESEAVIRGPTVIQDYSVIDNEAKIDRSIIWRNCYIGERTRINGAVILQRSSLKANSTVFDGAVIGDGTIIGEWATIHAGVKIWPGKEIGSGTTIISDIWDTQERKSLFGQHGITGEINIDFTPEFSTKVAAAYSATLSKGDLVTFSRDSSPNLLMLMGSAIGGLISSGICVLDLGIQPIPLARYFTRVSQAIGGVHFHLFPDNNRKVNVHFMDNQGLNISKEMERGIERSFFREDFRRVGMNDIGKTNNALQVREMYMGGFLGSINVKAIQEAKCNIVVDFASSPVADTLPDLLDALNCSVVALNANITNVLLIESKFQTDLKNLHSITSVSSALLGVRLTPDGERIILVDDQGHLLTGTTTCAAMVELTLRDAPGSTVAIPIDQPSLFEIIAKEGGGRVIRTEVGTDALIEATYSEGVLMAGDGKGNFIFPKFHRAIDGMMALAKILEFLITKQVSLSDVVSNLPPYYMAERVVSCVWEAKAQVIWLINEKFESYRTQTPNGIKINLDSNRWILIMSDPDQPCFRVIVEGTSQEEAETLADEYVELVEKLSSLPSGSTRCCEEFNKK